MYLKSLHIQGFKSFPDKTIIHLGDGLTAVVGPNGSGKSNVSDAIRWVLGEQSTKNLRGNKMEDVIFAGTQKRGPVGFAEVSLLFDNSAYTLKSEYSEVMVTRRYYRSGESEFYINKKAVRLKDIHEMFMDTGLGRDGYSIIGQGRIDEILSLKSEDRREIFEEAAGITKFRYKKEEAERKLAAAEENLVRIRDIILGLSEQIEPLSRQAEKAKQYLALYEQLKALEIAVFFTKLGQVKEELLAANDRVATCEADLVAQAARREAIYSEIEALSETLHAFEGQIDELRRGLRENDGEIAGFQSQMAVTQETIRGNKEHISRMGEDIERQNQRKQTLEQQIATKKAEMERFKGEMQAFISELEVEQQKLARLEDAAGEKNSDILAKTAALDQWEKLLQGLDVALATAQTSLAAINERQKAQSEGGENRIRRINEEKTINANLKKELETVVEELASASNMLLGAKMKIEGRKKKKEAIEQAVAVLEQEKRDSIGRLKLLGDMQKDYEGFSGAVKRVMTAGANGQLRGVFGPISSLLTTESRYAVAIETSLGGLGSNIVVQSSLDAKNAIAFLKKQDGGRATFSPIEVIRPSYFSEKGVEDEVGFVGIADKLVSCEDVYKAIVSNALGRTVIVEDIDCAITMGKKYQHKFRIVTLDGQQVNAGGSLTGGSMAKGSGSLARKATIEELGRKLTQIDQTLFEENKNLSQAAAAYQQVEYEITNITAIVRGQESEKVRLEATLSQQLALLESLEHTESHFEEEQARNQRLALELENQISALEQEKSENQGKKAAVQQEYEALLGQTKEQREAANDILGDISTIKTEIIKLESALQSSEGSIAELGEHLESMLLDETSRQSLVAELLEKNRVLEESLVLGDARFAALEEKGREITAQISTLSAKRMEIEGQRSAKEKENGLAADTILSVEREKGRLEATMATNKAAEKQMLDRLWESYELTPTMIEELGLSTSAKPEDEKEISTLKLQIRNIGSVNVEAIDLFLEVKEKFDFMSEQRDDIEKAKADIMETIAQLTGDMERIFSTEFGKLNQKFGETFCEIFGGGEAELVLADKNDILNCGIEINVTLPGKKLKTITLLSGGEKAFVAIALYFAILSVRPTPFCILDEIDAALDDVNVVRFAKYIRRLSHSTQFVVITHRRGTMEEADMLYGVTMVEQGISRLLMLNVNEVEKELKLEVN